MSLKKTEATVSISETLALKPCPFCGCEVYGGQLKYGAIGGGWIIEGNHADNCMMKELRFKGILSKNCLISEWNTRAKMKEDKEDTPGTLNLPYHYDKRDMIGNTSSGAINPINLPYPYDKRDKTGEDASDSVNHPKHYGGEGSVYETINVIEAWGLGFHLGNAVKYIARAGKKDPAKEAEDLKKAVWYLERRIHQLEGEE